MSKIRLVRAAVLAATGCVSGSAFALESFAADTGISAAGDPKGLSSDSDRLEEVVVTAERRTSDLQKTAASVSVRSGQALQEQGKNTVDQILEDVPGVLVSTPGYNSDSTGLNISIRGVPTNNFTTAVSPVPTTASYTDNITGALNIPVGEVFAARVAADEYKRHGYYSSDSGALERTSARIKLLYRPTDDLSLLVATASEDNTVHSGGSVATITAPNTFTYSAEQILKGKNFFRQYWADLDWDLGPGTGDPDVHPFLPQMVSRALRHRWDAGGNRNVELLQQTAGSVHHA